MKIKMKGAVDVARTTIPRRIIRSLMLFGGGGKVLVRGIPCSFGRVDWGGRVRRRMSCCMRLLLRFVSFFLLFLIAPFFVFFESTYIAHFFFRLFIVHPYCFLRSFPSFFVPPFTHVISIFSCASRASQCD